MKYKEMELKEFTSEKPVVFDPPRKMLVWDHLSSQDSKERIVYAYVPRRPMPAVICDDYTWAHCAEIPERKFRLATNRELIKWLAQGNGLCKHRLDSMVQCIAKCDKVELDNECNPNWNVCKWDDTEWHEPTADYMGLEEKQ